MNNVNNVKRDHDYYLRKSTLLEALSKLYLRAGYVSGELIGFGSPTRHKRKDDDRNRQYAQRDLDTLVAAITEREAELAALETQYTTEG